MQAGRGDGALTAARGGAGGGVSRQGLRPLPALPIDGRGSIEPRRAGFINTLARVPPCTLVQGSLHRVLTHCFTLWQLFATDRPSPASILIAGGPAGAHRPLTPTHLHTRSQE